MRVTSPDEQEAHLLDRFRARRSQDICGARGFDLLVRRERAGPALAPDPRPVAGAALRGDVAADPGKKGDPLLRIVPCTVSHPESISRRASRRSDPGMGRPRALQASSEPAPHGAHSRRRVQCGGSLQPRRAGEAARNRTVHGGRGGVLRLRQGYGLRGHERAPGTASSVLRGERTRTIRNRESSCASRRRWCLAGGAGSGASP